MRDLVADYGGRGRRIGVEYHAYGLTAQRGKMVDAAFAGFCDLVDASDLVRLLRLVKSPAELAYLRQAGRLVDEACAVSRRLTVPGAAVGAVYGEMMNAIMRGDGDPSASRWPMGCGEEALLTSPTTGGGAKSPLMQIWPAVSGGGVARTVGTWRNRRVGTPGSDRPARVGSRGNRDRRRAKPDSGSRLPAGGAGAGYSAKTAREIGHQNLTKLHIAAALEKARAHPPASPRTSD